MKTIFRILLVASLCMNVNSYSQEFIASQAKLSKEAIGKITSVSTNNLLILLDPQNNHFTIFLKLNPILSAVQENDSIARLNEKMTLHYVSDFPIDNLDFFEPPNEGKQYTIDGDLTVNNITHPAKISFFLNKGPAVDIGARDIHGYPVRISFAIEINPAEYGMDIETAKFTEKITIMVENGFINRTPVQNDQ